MIDETLSIRYMLAGYAAIFTVIVVYLVSLWARWRKLRRDLQTLDEIKK